MKASERTKRIVDRLPEFYRAWDPDSVIYKLIDAVGRNLNELQKDLIKILKAHWIDTAFGTELDAFGALFDLSRGVQEDDDGYRYRIKNALRQFKGGGTCDSILSMIADFLGVAKGELELVENPPTSFTLRKEVASGLSWKVGSMSIEDATPTIEIEVSENNLPIENPKLTITETGASVEFQGILKVGEKLLIKEDEAELDGRDVSDKLLKTAYPKLLRTGCTLLYQESNLARIGRFDHSNFDDSIFEIPTPPATVKLKWVGAQQATFELHLPRRVLEAGRISKEDVEAFLNVIKGAGIKSIVNVKE